MTGIQFITDEKGRKTAAVIDLKKHKALWEDIEDVLVSRSRRHEKRIPLDKVKAGLRGMLDSRYDDIKSGRVKPIDGEAFFETLRQREDELLKQCSK
ncbi:MAG: hypothetical protein ABSD63_04105 [Candidatus Korobacteraceae bacterium]|jgi:hypothetical protein